MARSRLPLTLLLKVAIFCPVWIAECKGDGSDFPPCSKAIVQKASIGEKLNINCTVNCPVGVYRWFNSTGPLQGETGADLTVSERVESAAAVGGQRYACQCGETEFTQCHLIWVTPFVKFNVSKKNVTLGSGVYFTCTAESYPSADNVTFFQLQHPINNDIPSDQLTLVNTSVVYHITNASLSDGGEYDCVVSVYESFDGVHLQSESRTDFIVYDPPCITSIHNFTLYSEPHGVESAVLECEVENKEDGLEVWVNWITGTRGQRNCVSGAGEHRVVFFLLLHNVTKEDVHLYICQLFSAYSPNKAEDQKTAEILIADTDACSGTPGQKPTSEGATTAPKEEDCTATGIIVGFVMTIITTTVWIIIIIISIVVKQQRRKGSQSLHQSQGENRTNRGNAGGPRYVDMNMISLQPPASQTSTQEHGDEHYGNSDSITDNQRASFSRTPDDHTAEENECEVASSTAVESKTLIPSEIKESAGRSSGASVKPEDLDPTLGDKFHKQASVTPKADLESQDEENERDRMGEGYSSSQQKEQPQSGRRLSITGGRMRSSSNSSYRRGSGPEVERLIND